MVLAAVQEERRADAADPSGVGAAADRRSASTTRWRRRLYTDGAELIFDYGEQRPDSDEGRLVRDLVVVRNGQRVFAETIEAYLRRIEYGPDGYASLIHVPTYERAEVVADPTRAFGVPIFERGGSGSTTCCSASGPESRSTSCRRSSACRPISSRTSCVSHPDELPDLFLDRSLGRVKVPAAAATAGLRLVTLAEHYGVPQDEAIADEEWLELAGTSGWVVLMKDTRIRYNLAEREAVKQHSVQAFCLSNQNLPSDDMASRFLDNLEAIANATTEPGPFIFAVHETRIERLPIGED